MAWPQTGPIRSNCTLTGRRGPVAVVYRFGAHEQRLQAKKFKRHIIRSRAIVRGQRAAAVTLTST